MQPELEMVGVLLLIAVSYLLPNKELKVSRPEKLRTSER
jgi:hypothetical protein